MRRWLQRVVVTGAIVGAVLAIPAIALAHDCTTSPGNFADCFNNAGGAATAAAAGGIVGGLIGGGSGRDYGPGEQVKEMKEGEKDARKRYEDFEVSSGSFLDSLVDWLFESTSETKSGLKDDLHHLSTDPGAERFGGKSPAEIEAEAKAHEESGQHPPNSLEEDIRKILDSR